MEKVIRSLIKGWIKLSKTYEKIDHEMPMAKWGAGALAFTLLMAAVTKPNDSSVHKMPTREFIHKYYGYDYKPNMSPEELENKELEKRKEYPFGPIGNKT